MGKLIIIVVAFMAVWVAYCEGRYHEQLEQVKPAKFQETEHVRLIERALREADAYHKSQEKLGNNNPGNLRGRGGEFQAFKSPKEGYNALVRDLKVKVSGNSGMMKAKLGKNYKPTLKNVLRVYAPPSENNTKHYISFVAKRAKINPNKILTVSDVRKIVPHMIVMEKGRQTARIYQQFASK